MKYRVFKGRLGAAAAILFIISALFSSKGAPYFKKARHNNAFPREAFVARVIDGDTILADGGYRIRYIGVNTPETKHPKKAVEFFGKEASDYNKKLVAGKKVRLDYDVQKFDRYGRLLAYVYADGVFVNAELVKEGYAQAYTMPPNVKHAELFLRLERNARGAKKGLWLTK